MDRDKLTQKELLECLRGWQMDSHRDNWREIDEQAYSQIKELIHRKPTVTRTEIENAVGDTSDEYCEGVVELFESKGFVVEK